MSIESAGFAKECFHLWMLVHADVAQVKTVLGGGTLRVLVDGLQFPRGTEVQVKALWSAKRSRRAARFATGRRHEAPKRKRRARIAQCGQNREDRCSIHLHTRISVPSYHRPPLINPSKKRGGQGGKAGG